MSPDPNEMHVAPPASLPSLGALPYLTADRPGVGGRIKDRPEDFVVTELAAYEPSGSGTHVYFAIQKTGLDTRAAVARIAQALGRPARDFGFAGMKDRHSVSRQTLSIEHVDPSAVEHLAVPGVEVLWVSRHTNKLRLGHLTGNRFEIKVRGVGVERLADAKVILEALSARGAPNFFGPQRFGARGSGHQLGLALIRRDNPEFIDLLLGRPDPAIDHGPLLEARERYERDDFKGAHDCWPRYHHDERAALHILARGQNAKRARLAVDKRLRRFFVSALQSFLFNEVLAERLATIDQVLEGDLAYKHGHGAVFRVADPAAEQPRADRLEISPSGPLYGYRMTWPEEEPGRIERDVVARHGIDVAWFGQGGHRVRGDRRTLRMPIREAELSAGADEAGPYLAASFTLPAGAYATVVLRELMKSDAAAAAEDASPSTAS